VQYNDLYLLNLFLRIHAISPDDLERITIACTGRCAESVPRAVASVPQIKSPLATARGTDPYTHLLIALSTGRCAESVPRAVASVPQIKSPLATARGTDPYTHLLIALSNALFSLSPTTFL